MLRSGRSTIRFTTTEIEELRALGIDASDVKSADDFAAALEPWLHALSDIRPDPFDTIAREIALVEGRLPGSSRLEFRWGTDSHA